MNRRAVLRYFTFGVVAAIAGTASQLLPRSAHAGDLPHVAKDDPMAKSLKYSEDAAHSERKTNDAFCHTCRFFKGADSGYGPCDLFPGKAVNANGWCSMWTKKA